MAIFAVATVFCLGEAKHFTRCGLVHALRAQGFPADKMADCKYPTTFLLFLLLYFIVINIISLYESAAGHMPHLINAFMTPVVIILCLPAII